MPAGTLPFRQFVLKVHSRCDLACDHCYVYELADQSWRGRPRIIASETVVKAAERIAEHVRRYSLPGVRVILHGGEPLLAGPSRLAEIARELRRAITPVCALDLRMQTNGIRLDEELAEVLLAANVRVGISLDGDRAANDRHRRYADGRSSYDQVIRAVDLLRTDRYRPLYAGLLCTIDVRNDPVATYETLAALEPPAIDFLLPHATWDTPPPASSSEGTPYADWLAAVFDRWHGDRTRVPVRTFESIIRTSRGGSSLTEALGVEPSDLAVIETDGTIEQVDSIKVAYDGAPATGLDIFRNELEEAAAHPGIRARQQGISGLNATCRQCAVVESCGGGLYAHRYRTGGGFGNPSVYCRDLKKIITHVGAHMRAATSAAGQPPAACQLPDTDFDQLASGFGGAESVSRLISSQRSLRRVLLELLHRRARPAADARFLDGWALLVRLQRESPTQLEQVLAHPHVRTWAEECLRSADSGGLPPAAGQLAAIAAAAAIRAGARVEVEVPIIEGNVHLPTLGRLNVGDANTAEIATGGTDFHVRTAAGRWAVRPADDEPIADWQPLRELVSAGGFSVRLEDTDPYRDCHLWPVAARLSAADVGRWQEQFTTAWSLIQTAYPAYAPGLAAGLSTIVPLVSNANGRDISSTARSAFGAVAIARPRDGDTLAQLLIHEFQHVKLGAMLDLFDLCDPTDRRRFYAPWRDDPRPVEALLQGAYAHIGVTDYWRVRRNRTDGPEALAAAERFARWRMLTAVGIDTLAHSGALTSLGDRFVARMRTTVESWLDEPVPASAAAAARQWATEHRKAWEQRQQA